MGARHLPHLALPGRHPYRGTESFPLLCRPPCPHQPHLLPFPGPVPFPSSAPRYLPVRQGPILGGREGQQRPWRTAVASRAPSLPWAGSTPSAFGTPCRDTLNPPCFQATWVISNMVADQGDTASFTGRRTVLKIKDTLGPLTPLLPWLWNRHLLSDGFLKARSQVEASGLAVAALLGEVTGVASQVFEVHTLD